MKRLENRVAAAEGAPIEILDRQDASAVCAEMGLLTARRMRKEATR